MAAQKVGAFSGSSERHKVFYIIFSLTVFYCFPSVYFIYLNFSRYHYVKNKIILQLF